MNPIFQVWLSVFSANKALIAMLALMFVFIAVLRAFLPRLIGAAGERRVNRALEGIGAGLLRDIYLPSRSGVTQVDHLAFKNGLVWVIETKNYSGAIFGSEGDKNWTVSLARGRRKHRLYNPLIQNGIPDKTVDIHHPSKSGSISLAKLCRADR